MWLRLQKVTGFLHSTSSRPPLWSQKYFRQTGLAALEPVYNLNWKPPYSDIPIFFSRDFMLPASSQQHFDKEKPIGRMMGDDALLSVVDEDDIAKGIYRGNIKGRSLMSLRINLVQAVQFFPVALEILNTNKELWTKSLGRRNDGSVVVLLNRFLAIAGCRTTGLVEFQDITDSYLPYL